MSGVAKILLSPIAAVAGALMPKPKAAAQPLPLPTVTPRSSSTVSDALMSRRGSAANQVTGTRGAESTTTAKKTLLGQ
ncbi:hypothetical protein S2M10_29420 [Sphingomonas sp. S2M10]|uniref:hypothetical protein n=1 Tax=Sphingomonas sp. S2M10 TaxID=2705010 RepID=UPI0014566928|nr:hypothetical protein [Sphingomonas sp. S2M10]NLS27940.1 hypothetical protein [Sphingomonas sp. S2M10]